MPFSSPAFDNDLRRWSRWRAEAPELWNGYQARRGQRSFPERNYGGWRRTLEEAARRIHSEHPVDLAIGTANPNVDFIPGWTLNREHGVPHVLDHRDAWSLDIYSGRRIVERRSPAGRWEDELIRSAHQVWFVNQPIRDWHAEQHPLATDRFLVVENGYDVPLEAPDTGDALPRTSLTFGYIGTISGAIPVAELVAGWALARERSPLVAASRLHLHGYLNHMGVPGENFTRALDSFAENDIQYLGPVPRAEVGRVYGTFDALVLTFGAGRYITGGKVYEYASTGLPIVSVHDPVNETSRILADHPGWHGAASLSPSDVADAIIATAEAAATQSDAERRAVQEHARRFARSAQLEPRIADLEKLVASRRNGVTP